MRFLLAFLLLATVGVRADPLADLRSTLVALDGHDTIRARVSVGSSGDVDDSTQQPAPRAVTATVEDGPAGLTITWDHSLLDAAAAERQARNQNPDQPMPTRNSLDELKVSALGDYFDAPALLLRLLERATLVSEETVRRDGSPARLLTLTLTPLLGANDKKYIKDIRVAAKIWLGADGTPVAAETHLHAKGRAMLVISFETDERNSYEFVRLGRRLMVSRHASAIESSGAGEKGHKQSLVILHPLAS